MDGKDKYALDWSEYGQHIIKAFRKSYETKDLTDVTLWVEGKCFQAHKFVLSACSSYFQDILRFHQNTPNLAIVLNEVKHTIMANILRFMYLGEVQVDKDILEEFLNTAAFFKIHSLTDQNEEEDFEEDVETSHPLIPRNSTDSSVDVRNDSWDKRDSDSAVQKKRVRKSDDNDHSLPKKKPSKPRRISSSSESEFQPNVSKSKKEEKAAEPDEAVQKVITDESYFDPNVNPNFECPVCGRAMSSMNALRVHYIVHMGDISCPYCSVTFSRPDILKRHIARLHNT